MYFRLDGRDAVPVEGSEEAMQWWGTQDRVLAQDEFFSGALVSTVFLTLDHAIEGPPLLFETMVFDERRKGEYQERYSTWDKAMAGHARAVASVQADDPSPIIRRHRHENERNR